MIPMLMWAGLGALGFYVASSSRRTSKSRIQRSIEMATGVVVAPGCDVYEIVDADRARLTFRRAYADARLAGVVAPDRIAWAIVRKFAPYCARARRPRSMGQLVFYANTFHEVLKEMVGDGLIDDVQAAAYAARFDQWYEQHTRRLF